MYEKYTIPSNPSNLPLIPLKCRQRLEDMRYFYNADLSVAGTPCDPPYRSFTDEWLSALSLNPARLIPDRYSSLNFLNDEKRV